MTSVVVRILQYFRRTFEFSRLSIFLVSGETKTKTDDSRSTPMLSNKIQSINDWLLPLQTLKFLAEMYSLWCPDNLLKMVTFRESGSHHSKGITVAIGRLLSRDVTSVKSPGASNYSHSPDHDKVWYILHNDRIWFGSSCGHTYIFLNTFWQLNSLPIEFSRDSVWVF